MAANDSPNTEWHDLRTKNLCTRGARDVTGADIIRIARTLAMEPWHFTQAAPAAVDDPNGIVVDAGRRRVRLHLANAAHGCVFLVRTPSGAGRCGLDDIAPNSCRHFSADTGDSDEKPGQDTDRQHWVEDVVRWNSVATRPDFSSSIEDFQRYILEAEYTRHAGLQWPEDAG